MKTHWKKIKNPDYLGSWDFQPNEEKIVTIVKTSVQDVTAPGGKSGKCTVLHFSEKIKPLATGSAENAQALRFITGSPYIEDWPNHKIKLYVKPNVKAFGIIVDAVRIRPEKIQTGPKKDYTPQIQLLENCTNMEELQSTYLSLTKDEQAATVSIKDQMKLKLGGQ